MAEIVVDNRCRSCGLPFEEGEEAILESRVILTRESTYATRLDRADRKGKVRCNFGLRKGRTLRHSVCPVPPSPDVVPDPDFVLG